MVRVDERRKHPVGAARHGRDQTKKALDAEDPMDHRDHRRPDPRHRERPSHRSQVARPLDRHARHQGHRGVEHELRYLAPTGGRFVAQRRRPFPTREAPNAGRLRRQRRDEPGRQGNGLNRGKARKGQQADGEERHLDAALRRPQGRRQGDRGERVEHPQGFDAKTTARERGRDQKRTYCSVGDPAHRALT